MNNNRKEQTKGQIEGILSNLLIIRTFGPVAQNEICFALYESERLLCEVIRVEGERVYAQVFENTRGLRAGLEVEFTGELLEVSLGPGMLSKIYDGLQNNLYEMEGVFLKRGSYTKAFAKEMLWEFIPLMHENDSVHAGDWLGEVKEAWLSHKIMAPFYFEGEGRLIWIAPAGEYEARDVIARVVDDKGIEHEFTMIFKWPVKRPVKSYKNKIRPYKIMETGTRVIDVFNPMVEGGTGFIPGPFGCGKTVLQHSISKYAEADLILVVACGERANEVVELFTEFPELDDPRSGRKLMERTIIICNTSNMPVAAREASVYTGMAMAEYYRAMGLRVLVLADSTSRWAQALREMSNRMEELPGPDAYPMDLPAIIANFYSRAGFVYLNNGQSGSITFIGTVSPAGGNLKEPVTESTKKVARAFYALSQSRADSRRYPAIDPLQSYSKYLEYEEAKHHLNQVFIEGWTGMVERLKGFIYRGQEIKDQINILGDDGVPVEYHILFWKSELIDFALLQQDSFHPVDATTPLERQKYMVKLVLDTCETRFDFTTFEDVSIYFKRMINVLKQLNYADFKSATFESLEKELRGILDEKKPE